MNEKLISIVMPVKNAGAYLPACLESILLQSNVNWELLAINDHSVDNSELILEEFSKKDARIKVFLNEGRGIIDALKLAYAKSSGDYITRMDADDLMSSHKLESLVKMLKESGKGHIALGLVEYFSESQLGDGYKQYAKWLNVLTQTGTNFDDLYRECVIPSPCWMVFREDLELAGAFNADIYPEDYDLCFRFFEAGLKCLPSDEVLHYWRDHESRTSRTSEVYSDNHFVDLKVHYFLRNHRDKNRPLMLWSAGKHAKKIAKHLINAGQEFDWICDNPNKIGHNIYGVILGSMDSIDWAAHPQTIVVVSNPKAKIGIRNMLNELKQKETFDYFFFC